MWTFSTFFPILYLPTAMFISIVVFTTLTTFCTIHSKLPFQSALYTNATGIISLIINLIFSNNCGSPLGKNSIINCFYPILPTNILGSNWEKFYAYRNRPVLNILKGSNWNRSGTTRFLHWNIVGTLMAPANLILSSIN